MTIKSVSPREIQVECGGITFRLEHIRFAKEDAVHLSFDGNGVKAWPQIGDHTPIEHHGWLVFTKPR